MIFKMQEPLTAGWRCAERTSPVSPRWWSGRLLGIGWQGRVAMALAGSQKTLPVAISLLAVLAGPVGEALLVCVMFHFLTLFADALIAPRLPGPMPAS